MECVLLLPSVTRKLAVDAPIGEQSSKALRHTITSTMKVLNNPAYREMGINARPTLEQLNEGTQAIIGRQVTMRQSFYDRNGVPVFRGQARFVDDHAISIDGDEPIRASILSLQLVRDRFTRIASISTTKGSTTAIRFVGWRYVLPQFVSTGRGDRNGICFDAQKSWYQSEFDQHGRSKLLEFLDDEIIDFFLPPS